MQMSLEDQLKRVEGSTSALWTQLAHDAVEAVAKRYEYFTTDEVWKEMLEHPPKDPRAMGAVMRWAVSEKLVVPSGGYRNSRRPVCNGRPIRVYRSLLRTEQRDLLGDPSEWMNSEQHFNKENEL